MANNNSAKKRIRQNTRRRLRNRVTLGSMRSAIRSARSAIEAGAPEAQALIQAAARTIDRAVSKGALKRETASRYISRLARRASAS